MSGRQNPKNDPDRPQAAGVPNKNLNPGRLTLDDLYRMMRIGEEWRVRADRSFTWRGWHLAQRVWVEPERRWRDTDFTCIQVQTDFLRDVPDTRRTAGALEFINRHASLSAPVWEKGRAVVKLTCALYCYQRNAALMAGLFSGRYGDAMLPSALLG